MRYDSQFHPEFSALVYQKIESIKPLLSEKALFLVEELKDATGISLKVLDNGVMFQVESLADTLEESMINATTKIIQMIESRTDREEVLDDVIEETPVVSQSLH